MKMNDPRLTHIAACQPYPLLFATISGAHLYGFSSPDSDYDLRGVHLLPLEQVIGLDKGQETIQVSQVQDGLELDLVTHDAAKFFNLLLQRNGYVLEQLYSPLVVHTTPEHQELKEIARGCLTRHHVHHYLGFARTQWGLFEKETPPRVKPLLYVFRVLLTGIYLMQTGEIQANLPLLNEIYHLAYIPELIERKTQGAEKSTLSQANLGFYHQEYQRLVSLLEDSGQRTDLPDTPSARQALHDLLVRIRLAQR
jgi:predicted nucleotidyltransferase